MLDVDIEQFVLTGEFGSLGQSPTREAVHELLGPPDEQPIAQNEQYGNVTFEFATELNCIYRVLIAYPHSLFDESLGSLIRPYNTWPDPRFSFTPGWFRPGLRLCEVVNILPGFEHLDVIGESPHRICVFANLDTNIFLCFAPQTALAEHSLYCIVSQPQPATFRRNPTTMTDLPADISESLSAAEIEPVANWWMSLSDQQRADWLDCSRLTADDFKSLEEAIGLDKPDVTEGGDELPAYFDYLVNHEFRLVGFADQTATRSSYRVMCGYIASLGSDYRHGKPGSVR